MTLTQEQEQIVALLRDMAMVINAESDRDHPSEMSITGSSNQALPWKQQREQTGSIRDFGVGMPPLTQRYS